MANDKRRKGNAMLEFVLTGIPMIFVLISLFEVSRALWMYDSLAYAVREGARYASVHGRGCAPPKTCRVTVGQITGVIRSAGAGIDPNATTLTLTPASGPAITDTIANLLANSTTWPPASANGPGENVKISLVYPFRTILAMFWPGAGAPVGGAPTFHLKASSTEAIQF